MREEKKRSAMDGGKSERASTTDDAGEPAQGTPPRKGARLDTEPLEGKTPGRCVPTSVATKLERIATRARERPQEVITTLNHFIDVEWLKEGHRLTRKDGAVGIDGMTAGMYAANLEENLAALHDRLKTRTYRAPPVKRVYIPKGDGSKRPIGIPTFEDKVLQRSVAMILEAIYEQEFRDCSYGFRRRRNQHQALDTLWSGLTTMKGGFVIEVDIQGFFDSLDHTHLRNFLDLRVRDGVLRQVIGSWLKAGVLDDGCFEHSDEGTPQGGVISPLLANVFLHHVFDVWFEDEIKPRLAGEAFLVRFADDIVIVLDRIADASRVMDVLPKRFGKYGLTLHPEKTRLVRFKRPNHKSDGKGRDEDNQPPGTFSFLGFTHYWVSEGRGRWEIRRKTEAKRLRRTLKAIATWCKAARHWPVVEQHRKLRKKLEGHETYFGLPENRRAISTLIWWTGRIWRYWLNRRSRQREMPWATFTLLLGRFPLRPMSPHLEALMLAAKP